jgi:eukaryotic-like serine/threonine-protein kinase
MIGKTLGHYRILEKLGEGGMGVVYRAHDERLERDVALKVLPADLLNDEGAQKRFRKEALALSKLNHANIAAVYDFDVVDGISFLVMELVEGRTLAKRIAEGAMLEKEVAALGTQIAEALEEAHEHGIVHRDLKPGNVVVTAKGRAKVLDFGLAKLLHRAEPGDPTRSLTETRAVAGTLPYMAPEQLRGEALDARSDLYALGAALYEMATGQRAFRDELSSRLADAILHQPPVAPRALNPRISPELERIILKCLEKDPENRYQSAKETAVDLRRLGAASTSTIEQATAPVKHQWKRAGLAAAIGLVLLAGALVALNVGGLRSRWSPAPKKERIESLAVLPLENFSHDPEQNYFADGMTDELITNLAKIRGLRVISRTSAMQYRGTKKSMRDIGKELNVDALVEGSVQRAGDRVRITAQLIRAATDTHIWAESYDGDLRDVLALQSNVARAIAKQVQAEVSPIEESRLAASRTVNPAAHEAYLKGLYEFNAGRDTLATEKGHESLRKSIRFYKEAIQVDTNDALAYAGMARSYHWLAGVFPKFYDESEKASRKAIQLDDSLAEAHGSLAYVMYIHDWDWAGAEREFKRAIELNPSYGEVHHGYALLLNTVGRHDEAIAEIDRGMELDPLVIPQKRNAALIYACAGQYDRAIQTCRSLLDLNPNDFATRYGLGATYLDEGKYPEGIEELRRAHELSRAEPGFEPLIEENLAWAYATAGRRVEARQILARLTQPPQEKLLDSVGVAAIYAALGEKDKALAWLEKAYQERSLALTVIHCGPDFNVLRSDPRYQDLLRRMNLPQ